MSTKFDQFNDLHHQPGLFVLPNVWNAKSAAQIQQNKFPALATSSAAVAESLGYEDGEQMPFNTYLLIIKRILAATSLPLTIDIEMGYAIGVDDIYSNLLRLIELGVVGINIEDSTLEHGKRVLGDATNFARNLETIRNRLTSQNLDLFINVRCDTYILDVRNKEKETKTRARLYENSGASGLFLPCICDPEDIQTAAQSTSLPLNIMWMPGLPNTDTLEKAGVKRLSMGPFLFNKVYDISNFLTLP